MISTTAIFYANVEDVINTKWKHDYSINYRFNRSIPLNESEGLVFDSEN